MLASLLLLCACGGGPAWDEGTDPLGEEVVQAGPRTEWLDLWGEEEGATTGEDMAFDPLGGFVGGGAFALPGKTQLGVARYRADGTYVMMMAHDFTCLDEPCHPGLRARHAVGPGGVVYSVASFMGPVQHWAAGAPYSVRAPLGVGLVQKILPDDTWGWMRALGGQHGLVRPDDVVALADGGFVVVGVYEGAQELGGASLPDGAGAFVARFEPDGRARWAIHLEMDPAARLAVVADAEGRLLVGGAGPGRTADGARPLVTCLDAAGRSLWSWQPNDLAGAVVASVVLPQGGFMLAIQLRDASAPVRPTVADTDAGPDRSLLVVLGPDGALQWQWQGRGRVTALAADGDRLLVAGEARGPVDLPGRTLALPEERASLFMAGLMLGRELVWVRTFTATGAGALRLAAAALLPDGASVYAGSVAAPVSFDGEWTGPGGISSSFFLELAPPSSAEEPGPRR